MQLTSRGLVTFVCVRMLISVCTRRPRLASCTVGKKPPSHPIATAADEWGFLFIADVTGDVCLCVCVRACVSDYSQQHAVDSQSVSQGVKALQCLNFHCPVRDVNFIYCLYGVSLAKPAPAISSRHKRILNPERYGPVNPLTPTVAIWAQL